MVSDKIYIIDTSALMDGWIRYYPPDILPSLWKRLEDMIENKRLISPVEVKLELARKDDDLHKWVSRRESMFHEITDDIQSRLTQIVNRFPNFVPDRSVDGIWADPHVIALAEETGSIVITGEKMASENARKFKIPNICKLLNIKSITLLDLIRREQWQF